jgi:hypothetical protein
VWQPFAKVVIMLWLIATPVLFQGMAMVFDEFYFHHKRGLPRWERIGHPLDTFSVLICIGFVLFVPFSWNALSGFATLAFLSCLFVTKDEFVHKELCGAKEQWLHSILFVTHPMAFVSAGFLWAYSDPIQANMMLSAFPSLKGVDARLLLTGHMSVLSIFAVYQIVYWNIIYKGMPNEELSRKQRGV